MGKYSFTCEYCGKDCGYTCEKSVVFVNREEGYEAGLAEAEPSIEQLKIIKKIIKEWEDDPDPDDRNLINKLIKALAEKEEGNKETFNY